MQKFLHFVILAKIQHECMFFLVVATWVFLDKGPLLIGMIVVVYVFKL